jgi:N-hydroxyarylamine O-acetyltransferase
MFDLDRYLARVRLDGTDLSLAALHRAHVTHIPYENLDVQLGREIHLDAGSLMTKLVDQRRGGYCFEMNTLFAAALEASGHDVTRMLGRVRFSDRENPRPETHMVLRVGDDILDVGFGSATPIGPVPLGGEATYGPWTWRTEPITTPEGEAGWAMWFFDMLLYTFTETPRHAIDYVAPNHFTSTHPLTIFANFLIAQRWDDDDTQIGLVDLDLTVRCAGQPDDVTRIDPADLDVVLRDRFGLELDADDVEALQARVVARRQQ